MAQRPFRVGTWLRVALGIAGLVILAALVRHVGTDVIARTLRPALAWLPLLCALETCRIAGDTLASYSAFGSLAKRIPIGTLFRAHLVGHSIMTVAPAPRAANEAIKVALLVPYVGAPAATSVGFTNQAATLISVGLFSIPCGIATYVLSGASLLFWACVVHAFVLVVSGLALRATTRAHGPGHWIAQRFPKLAEGAALFRDHSGEVGLWARGPTTAMIAGRCVQALQFGIAAHAVGIDTGVARALAAQGVNLVASAVGVLVPGGFGTTDGAFTLAAGTLGTDVVRATSLALLIRCIQLVWLLVGSMVLFLWPSAPKGSPESAEGET